MSEVKIIVALWVVGAAINISNNLPKGSDTKVSENQITNTSMQTKYNSNETVYKIPSDPHGRYKYLKMYASDSNLVVITERIGKGGITSYSTREIDCNSGTFRYLANGDTLEQMYANMGQNEEQMGPLSEGSISSYVAGYACDVMHDRGGYKYRTTS
jgi:hypothetical protein